MHAWPEQSLGEHSHIGVSGAFNDTRYIAAGYFEFLEDCFSDVSFQPCSLGVPRSFAARTEEPNHRGPALVGIILSVIITYLCFIHYI
jgi:hypothetical protein